MRAALLPTPGNPQMLAYWLRNFETWREHVDELLILINGGEDYNVRDPKIRIVHTPMRMGHDGTMRWLLEITDAEYIVLCEDDAYVRHPGAVGGTFWAIENGFTDLVGSPRHEDYAGQTQDWGPYVPGDLAELRHGLWPAFLFARRADLLATDRIFGDRRWNVGETIAGWGTITPEACAFVGIAPDYIHLDTLFGTTFQLRAAGLRTELVHHVRLFDGAAAEEWIAEDPPWFHVTGLSTLDQYLTLGDLPDWDENGGLWARRAAWWRRVGIDVTTRPVRGMAAWDARFDRWAMEVPA